MKSPVPKTSPFLRFVDYLMVPVMFLLGGFKTDSLQETHPWHIWKGFSEADVQLDQGVTVVGSDSNTFSRRYGFLFHAPVIGGWKNYTVLSPIHDSGIFHIGWLGYKSEKLIGFGMSRLPIKNGAIRVLDGPPGYKTIFIAVDENGRQITLKKVGSGKLGDNKFKEARLF